MPEVEVRRPAGRVRRRGGRRPAATGRAFSSGCRTGPVSPSTSSSVPRSASSRCSSMWARKSSSAGARAGRPASPPSARARRRSTTAATPGPARTRARVRSAVHDAPPTSAGASCSGANSNATWPISMCLTIRVLQGMAARDTPPYRADHVGSLLRPPALLQGARGLRQRHDRRRRAARRSRTTRSATRSSCRRTSACARPPTASSAARPGTWTSSTASAASPRRPAS